MSALRQPSKADQARQNLVDDVTDAVDDLIRQVRTTVLHTRDKGRGADGTIRKGPTSSVHRTRQPGLLVQLKASTSDRGTGGWDADGALSTSRGGKPTSRPPLRVDTIDLLADVQAGARAWRERLGGVGRRPFVAEMRGLVGLARTASNSDLKALRADLQSWVRTARIALAYDAPTVDLVDMVCPDCQGVLRVLADASSDVWCAGGPWPRSVIAVRAGRPGEPELVTESHGPRDWTPGCGASWPQGQWVLLLEQTDLVEDE